jgi:hypothetical protein
MLSPFVGIIPVRTALIVVSILTASHFARISPVVPIPPPSGGFFKEFSKMPKIMLNIAWRAGYTDYHEKNGEDNSDNWGGIFGDSVRNEYLSGWNAARDDCAACNE